LERGRRSKLVNRRRTFGAWEGDGDVGAALTDKNSRGGQKRHSHPLVVALRIRSQHRIINHANRYMFFPKCVVVHGTNCPEQTAGALACSQCGGWKMTKNEWQDVCLL
jgi:hypothetical protein